MQRSLPPVSLLFNTWLVNSWSVSSLRCAYIHVWLLQEVVATAMQNADRYYRVMTSSMNGTTKDPDNAAKAFKAVASQWLQQRQQACTVLAVLTAGEVLFLGLLWRLTGDMAAPLTAATMMTAVECAFVRKLTDAGTKQDR